VIPCGNSRSSTTAAASRATSPNTGVKTKETMVLTPPNKIDEPSVPAMIATPHEITVIKAFAMYIAPIVGTTPTMGAISAPLNPVTAAPTAKVVA